ncbi:unnamed protein product [Nesidiocoris tenuis]|uniref:PPM-type phosphatase domain-containing protein n=1 Tax=Nesidiocoris tenuis TaxID=355587 RepID=A0A6H5G3X0_9HEMI|nr:unnamed protein product [Nesidiocoris tenuis]
MEEVERILSEHPPGEKTKIIERERLLGQLAPLRAFGDFRYKWSREELERLAVPRYGKTVIAPHYETPPYLTAKPDVMYHRISPKDKFLVIASDGLWDLLSPLQVTTIVDNFSITTTTTTTFSSLVGVISSMSKGLAIVYIAHLDPFTVIGRQVVRMVGEHMSGRAALSPLRLPHNMKLKDINTILEQRKDGLNKAWRTNPGLGANNAKPCDRMQNCKQVRPITQLELVFAKSSAIYLILVREERDEFEPFVLEQGAGYLRNAGERIFHDEAPDFTAVVRSGC